MNLKSLRIFFTAVSLLGMVAFLFFENFYKKSILILHSYNTDYAWVKDVNAGINRVLGKERYHKIYYHYMDTKNHPEPKEKERAAVIANKIIDYLKPNIIYAIDDDAQSYVAKNYIDTPNMSIVFTAVNAKHSIYGYDKASNVTGMLERIPYEGVKEAIMILGQTMGKKPPYTAMHISDRSIIVEYDDANMYEYPNWTPITYKSHLVETLDEWKQAILNNNSDFVLVSNYRKVYNNNKEKKIIPFKEILKWTYEHSPVPVIGINGFTVEDGLPFAIAASPFEQGQIGAKMVKRILNGESPKNIPVQMTKLPIVSMDLQKVKASNFHLPLIYEAFARAIEKIIDTDIEDTAIAGWNKKSKNPKLASVL